MRWRIFVCCVGFLSFAAAAALAQIHHQNVADQDPLEEIRTFRTKLFQATEENIQILRSLQFNLGLAAVCLYDIDGIQDDLGDKLSRLDVLMSIGETVAPVAELRATLIQMDVQAAMKGLDSKRRRVQLSTRVCGSIPVVVTRAQVASSLLDGAERTLSRLFKPAARLGR